MLIRIFLLNMLLSISTFATDLPGALGYLKPHSDAFLEPMVITKPGTEYGDAFRCYQGGAAIEYIAKGRLWAAWYGGGIGENRFNYIMLATSRNNGETWSDVKLVVDSDCTGTVPRFDSSSYPSNDQIGVDPRTSGPRRVFDPCLWKDPKGRLWLFFSQERRIKKHGKRRPVVMWAIMTTNPEAENPKWSSPRQIATGVMLNKPTVLSNGEWLLPVAYWQHNPSAGVIISRDSGNSFEYLGGAGIFPKKMRNCDEHIILERKDGSLWMLVRGYMNKIMESVSTDRGKTWSRMDRKDSDKWPLRHINSRFFITRLASGRILLVKHGAIGERTPNRTRLMAFLSEDDGKTWKGGLMLDDRLMVSYPDGVEGENGQLYVIYDYERRGNMPDGKSIYLARFCEKDILAGRAITKTSQLKLLVNQAKAVNLLEYHLSKNTDGVAISKDMIRNSSAELEPLNGGIDKLVNGVELFVGRHDTALQIPPVLLGKKFIRAPRNKVRFKVKEPGLVFVLTPFSTRSSRGFIPGLKPVVQPYSQVDFLLKRGFKKTNFPETILMHPGPDNVVSVYYKKMNKGDKFEVNEWGLVVF